MTEHHPEAHTPKDSHFLDDIVTAYGKEDAMCIADSIVSGIEYTQAMLNVDMSSSLKLRMGVTRPPGIHDRNEALHAWSNGPENVITIMINPDAAAHDILTFMSDAIAHETGHLAHYYFNPKFGKESDRGEHYTHFAAAIREGIARSTEVVDMPDAYKLVKDAHKNQSIITKGLRLLLVPNAFSNVDRFDLLYGRTKEIPDMYAIGQYVVSCFALSRALDLRSLMHIPLIDYVDFAESELL